MHAAGWKQPKDAVSKLAEWLFIEDKTSCAGNIEQASALVSMIGEHDGGDKTIEDFGEDERLVVD